MTRTRLLLARALVVVVALVFGAVITLGIVRAIWSAGAPRTGPALVRAGSR